MDLSRFSDSDLVALKSGDISKLSNDGLVALRSMTPARGQPSMAVAAYDPTEGMSTLDKLLAGAGKAFYDTGRGAGQLLREGIEAFGSPKGSAQGQPKTLADRLGLPTRADIDEANHLDSPLMNTGAGQSGNLVGNLALALPTVAIPGAATLKGAAAIGGVQGLLQPVGTEDSRLKNGAVGAGAGAAGVAAGRALIGGAQAAKALVQPFTEGGRQKIVGNVIQRFADDPNAVLAATGNRTITGAIPTIAEETGDAGMARLQDAVRALDPQISNRISGRLADNNASRVQALESLGGDSAKRAAAESAREAASADLYRQATAANYTVDSNLQSLLDRPAVKKAMSRAQELAANNGRTATFDVAPANAYSGVGIPDNASKQIGGQALQDLKMAMDEMLTDPTSGFAGKAGDTVRNLRSQLVDWMEKANPDFKAARVAYRDASKPLNAMDIGDLIARKATSNTSDLAGNPRMQASALLGLLRDEPGLIEKATGRKGVGNALSDVMTPDQVKLLNAVANETDRAAAVATAGSGPGSATAQRMASQNVLSSLVGPTGLPKSWAESVLANTALGKPLNLIYGGVAEPKIQQALADAVLNPQAARNALAASQSQGIKLPQNALTELLMHSARITPSTVSVTGKR